MGRQEGRVTTIVKDRAFGFIVSDLGGEHFFHKSHMLSPELFETLKEETRVRFLSVSTAKGLRATEVEVQ